MISRGRCVSRVIHINTPVIKSLRTVLKKTEETLVFVLFYCTVYLGTYYSVASYSSGKHCCILV